MADTQSLAEKLKQADGKELTLALARLKLEHYFFAIADMLGDRRFDEIYNNQRLPDMKGAHDLVCQFLHQLPRTQERTGRLYQILIEPFLAMRIADGIEEDMEEENDDTYDY